MQRSTAPAARHRSSSSSIPVSGHLFADPSGPTSTPPKQPPSYGSGFSGCAAPRVGAADLSGVGN